MEARPVLKNVNLRSRLVTVCERIEINIRRNEFLQVAFIALCNILVDYLFYLQSVV